MRIIEETQLDLDDVAIMPKRSSLNSRSEVNLFRTFNWTSPSGSRHSLICKPLVVANMATVGTPKMAKFMCPKSYIVALEKHYDFATVDKLYSELEADALAHGGGKTDYTDLIAMSIGIKDTLEVLQSVSEKHKVNIVNIDAPNGYCPSMLKRVEEVRKLLPEAFIIAGTVVTGDIVTDLIVHGANCVRVGICCGSSCLTAQKTGVRRPVVSMLMECVDAAHNIKGYTMLDGGIRCPGDWCKATIAGADFCMSGAVFAGTDMAEGEVISKWYATGEYKKVQTGKYTFDLRPVFEEKRFKLYFGMSSDLAQEKLFGGVKQYRTSEGREKLIPYTGKLEDVLRDYEGGVASMMTYIGARDFKAIQRHGTLYKVNHQLNTMFADCQDYKRGQSK